jgi:hypothetical protein
MSFLIDINYQPIVDTLVKLGKQLNKPSYRFLKGEVIGLALEKATDGRLQYVDEAGYDSVDLQTGYKYELKSTSNMFDSKGNISGRVSLSNTNKVTFSKTFDYLLCIQTEPSKFSIGQLSWDECNSNYVAINGQFNLKKGIPISTWICRNSTSVIPIPSVKLDVRKLLESVL